MAARYTPESLAEAARRTDDWDGAVRWCGGTPTPGSRRHLRGKMAEAGVATSHFRTGRARHTKEALGGAVALSSGVGDVLRRIGLSPVGGNHAHISRRIAAPGIDTSHFTSGRRHGRGVPDRASLAHAAARSTGIAGVLRALGLPGNGAQRSRVRRALEAYAVPTTHFTGRGHRRRTVARNRKPAAGILRRRETGSSRARTAVLRRALDEPGGAARLRRMRDRRPPAGEAPGPGDRSRQRRPAGQPA